MSDLMTRAELAAKLEMSERTLRRHLAQMPNLSCYRFGRTLRFDEQDVASIKRNLRCPYPTVSEATSGTSAARSASVGRPLRSGSTQQDATRELMLRLSGRQKKPASERKRLKDQGTGSAP